MKRREEAARIYDERFCRMWELYLITCELGFRHLGLMVFQIQLAKTMEALPTTRNYMVEWEEAQAERDRRGDKSRAA
jgi:cyclopropane-fatty-acyl-phospholipid synthase